MKHLGETNLQNIPREKSVKRMFIPRPGYLFVEADLSQAEPRIVAYKARETKLIKIYKEGGDTHSFVASLLFGKEVRKGMPERQHAKPIANGSNYNMGPKTLADTFLKETGVELALNDARRLQNRYFQQFSGIKQNYHKSLRDELAMGNRIIINPFGRRRKFWTPWGDELFRQAYSHYAQSTVADIMNHAMIRCKEELDGVVIAAQVHDSLLFEVPKDTLICGSFEPTIQKIKECMSVPFKIYDEEVVIPVEVKYGFDWGRMEEVKSV